MNFCGWTGLQGGGGGKVWASAYSAACRTRHASGGSGTYRGVLAAVPTAELIRVYMLHLLATAHPSIPP